VAEQRVPRRLAAILAADVVGYSRLMQQDEAGTLAVLKERRKGVLKPLVVFVMFHTDNLLWTRGKLAK
jgi:adenylate cyclase